MTDADETAHAGKKLELAHRSATRRDFDAWMLRVTDFMLLKPKQQAARIVQVRCPNPDVISFAGANADAIHRKVKELAAGSTGSSGSEEAQLTARIWAIAVEGVVDDPTLGYSVFGYTVAPTRADIYDPSFFRLMTNRNQTFFHPKGFNKKQYYRAERSDQIRVRHVHGTDGFDFPAFDPRFVIVRWLNDIKTSDLTGESAEAKVVPDPDPVPDPVPVADPNPATVPDPVPDPVPVKPKKSRTLAGKKSEPVTAPSVPETPQQVLQNKSLRVSLADQCLPPLIEKGAIELLDEKGFVLSETHRFGFFPSDFAVDIAGIFGPAANEKPWSAWPLASAIFVAANPDRFALQGVHRYLKSHSSQGVNGTSLRTDTLTRVLDGWSRNGVANTWDMATLSAEAYAACKALDILAVDDSVLFEKARTLLILAELTDRILRVSPDATVPTGGRTCAFSGELIAADSRAISVDLKLRSVCSDTVPDGKFVRLWIAPLVHHWLPTDTGAPAAPAKKKKTEKRAREEEPAGEPASAPAPKKARKAAAAKPKPKPEEEKEKVLPALEPDYMAHLTGCPEIMVRCDALWQSMRAQLPAQTPEQLAAVRRVLALDKPALRAWVAADAPSNYTVFDLIHRFLVPETQPNPKSAISLLSSDEEDDADAQVPAKRTLDVKWAAGCNPATLATLMSVGKKERAKTESYRTAGAPTFFETRIRSPADLKSLAPDAYEWTVFAALFDTRA